MKQEISPIIYGAIERMKLCFGGTDVKLVSTEMYRQPPSEHCKLGYLGVDIKVSGVPAFLGCESMAEDICGPWGQSVANHYVYTILSEANELYKTTQT